MDRAPYPARIAAGLIVTALEETRKLPALLITLPMTAVSQTLQAGMRAQQNIAELAIKGDAALEMFFDRPDEQPEWARFDEDEAEALEPDSTPAPATPTPDREPAAKTPAPTSIDDKVEEAATDADLAAPPRADAGRFALYSSTPDDVVAAEVPGAEAVGASNGSGPEIVELIDYDSLTLAQLRARLRSVAIDDLMALVDYEKTARNRAPFVTMLENRIAAQNKRSTEA
ncbi:lipid droplet-associated protein [Gordonia McavH-238-E]|uniref:lipid droplet-associated protein n=1 Tax=Gordonia sp. McavH-238-E TaxID=2917736 RepID=UPI001EF40F93|nr:lipid droplet-associated protein [Gordonia sp. McavH-238-E]MCG7632103.1 lipid droplet-associated protein [Gordonia sp. McavH-238-E]